MSRARDLSKLSSPSNFTVDINNNIGVNSTSPDAKFDVVGIVSATKYFGDGSESDWNHCWCTLYVLDLVLKE